MLYKFVLTGIFIFSGLVINDLIQSPGKAEMNLSFHFKSPAVDFWEPHNKKEAAVDTAALKQSNWYAQAMQGVSEKEYEINYDTAAKSYTSPNRKHNLRSLFTAKTFILQPRNDSADKWKLSLSLKGIYAGKQEVYAPVNNAAVTRSGKTIRFNHNNNFTVEYINSEEGVRQNFIIQKSPASQPKIINIKLKTNNNWFVNKVNDKEIHFAKAKKDDYDKKITYNGLKVWDATNKELNARFDVVKNDISISVNTANAIYPITIDPLSTTPAAIVESNQTNAQMGFSVASAGDVNGDGYSDVIVGTPFYDNGQSFEGAAFVFHGSLTGISITPAAIVESNQAGAVMGYSVASAGDVNRDGFSDVIVGVYNYSNGQFNEGAAFVYHGSAAGIITTAAAMVESNQASAQMGVRVACAGDVNGDGYSDVIVGAHLYSNGQPDEGAAFVYHGSATGISTIAAVLLEANQSGANMGNSVASAGDVNGDGYSDVIVGAGEYNNGQSGEGAFFVYHGSVTGINSTAAAQVIGNQTLTYIGVSVACAGDVNGDGYSDVIVGAFGYQNGEFNEGAAFLYQGSVTGINTTSPTVIESNQSGAFMGVYVASAGDINGDGYSDVIVGANGYDNGQNDEGAAFVYYGSATGLSTVAAAQVESNQADAQMGVSVASAGDVNGDGYSDVIVGAYLYDNGQADEGAAFVYHSSASGISTTAATQVESNQVNARMGWSVASAGDVNGDGYSDVIVGAYFYDNGQTDEGAAFVYHGSATGIGTTAVAMVESNQVNAQMGWSVASAGDVNGDGYSDIIVGAWLYDNEGSAFIYHGSPSGINIVPVVILKSNQGNAAMGYSVTSAGDVNGDGYSDVIVGAASFDDGQTDEGAAFIYHGSANGIINSVSTMVESNQPFAFMGWSVASAGDVNGDGYSDIIVGAPRFDNGQSDEGVAFVYHGSSTGINPTASAMVESNNASAGLGGSVASAGDVNGDGYSDVIVGADNFTNGQTGEGAAFIYHGSSIGISTSASAMVESNQVIAFMGSSVASAGDVNGDGYSDVIIGAYNFTNGQSGEGAAFVYNGSPTGIITSTPIIVESNQIGAQMGRSVACAGDINGDGYSDVIVGAYTYTNGENTEGAAFVYVGNSGGLRNNLRLYNTDLVTPIQRSNILIPNLFGAGLFAKSPLGRVKGKLVWEVKKQGQAFSGNPITNSTAFLAKQPSFTNLGIAGTELKYNVAKQGRQNKIRVRVEYDKVTAITGQVYGPWRYPPGYTQGAYGMNATPLPVTLISFNSQFINADDVLLKWISTNEINLQQYVVERSNDGVNFTAIGLKPATGNGSNRTGYSFIDKDVKQNLLFYRLKLVENSGNISYSNTIALSRSKIVKGFIAPNPLQVGKDAVLTLESVADKNDVKIFIYNASGQLSSTQNRTLNRGRNDLQLAAKNFVAGLYLVKVSGDGIKEIYKLLVQ